MDESNPEQFSVFDVGDGIDLQMPLSPGVAITVFMTDECAQDLVNIIQNKLNARWNP